MRRGVGVATAKNKSLAQARYKDKSNEIEQNQMAQMAKQMEKLKVNLEDFAAKHKEDILKDPGFRVSFQEMCASIGVDPLACKSVYSEGSVSMKSLMESLKWEEERASRALDYMVRDGLAWVDVQAPGDRQYWFPSFCPDMTWC
uniref:Vacuolar-sorting protein SNF8 n=1 Tax=Crassostrea virginica TaxID=6565 RepID=A0A8B8BQM4_CRAVI|nr:vacuolar-sorting protein SNF8-like [Crassostrea virginica]